MDSYIEAPRTESATRLARCARLWVEADRLKLAAAGAYPIGGAVRDGATGAGTTSPL